MTSWLHRQRLDAVLGVVRASKASSVLDLGCGDGDLLTELAEEPQIERLVGIDLSHEALARLRVRLGSLLDDGSDRIKLVHGSLIEAGPRYAGFDCAVLVETIEHVDPARLGSLERAVFATMRPATVVVTTPNAEFNRLLGVPANRFRHPDHRFEWDRPRFRQWAEGVASRNGYQVSCSDIAGNHRDLGGTSQMAVFERPHGDETARP
ncbi:MAG: methyltransferase domain-containing protein [Aurantimonas endophytica]|uniref:Small RNA 2'-O-methyltransferase n=1 Tax=Aurantimonas endophytica TaxID=1522175 RepID=A0A7W6MR23_9HYPH|nr:methyltransferase domain-containing protein [Aurantimonas endophytica]MBB4004533.1 3' terminal RNA ribose 2'-O-methyltransferase Hen1 [Aurantimonas endophytica]MCO6405369.1 methyltransferase domain-containing protein [Aurantimonas endophytica]